MATKNETDGSSDAIPPIKRIKTEPSGADLDECEVDSKGALQIKCEDESRNGAVGEVEGTAIIKQVFIKDENHPDAEAMHGMALDSIKSEPNQDWDKYDADDKETLAMEIENNKLDMEMCSQVKEPVIKDERDEDAAAGSGILPSRIKKECDEDDKLGEGAVGGVKSEADMDSEDFKVTELTEDFDIKSESETNTDADMPSSSTAKSKLPRKQHQVVCKKAGRFTNFITSLAGKTYECTECNYKTTIKSYFHRHLSVHPKTSTSYKLFTCIHCDESFKSKISLDDHIVRKHPDFITSVTSKLHECTQCIYKTAIKTSFNRHQLKHLETASGCKLRICVHCDATFENKTSLEDHVIKNHLHFITPISKKT